MRSTAIVLLAAALLPVAHLRAADAPVIKAAPLEIGVVSAQTAGTFPVYTGSGAAIRAADGEMQGVLMARDAEGKTSNYLRASLTAENGRTLVRVGVQVVNGGKAPVAFRLGDLAVAGPDAVLMALGEGMHAFTKDEAALGKIKAAMREIPAGQKLVLVYVYSVKTESAPGKLAYKGKQSVDLKGIAQPAA